MNTKLTIPTNLINDVILAAHPGSGGPPLPVGTRSQAEAWLTRVLVDPVAFDEHVAYLRRQFQVPAQLSAVKLAEPLYLGFPFNRPLAEDEAFRIDEEGFVNVSDEVLAELLLNPVALDLLRTLLDDTESTVWLHAQAAMGLELFGGELPSGIRSLIQQSGALDPGVGNPSLLTGGATPTEPRRIPKVEALGSAAFPSVGRLSAPQGSERSRKQIRWEFEVPSGAIEWHKGNPPLVGDQTARVIVKWSDEECLCVVVDGFLSLGLDYTLVVEWKASDGQPLASNKSENDFEPVRLETVDHQPPRPGDQLHLRHIWSPQGMGEGWDIQLNVMFYPVPGSPAEENQP